MSGKQAPWTAIKGEKRAGKKRGKIDGGENKRKRKNGESYAIYIYNVLKQAHPDWKLPDIFSKISKIIIVF